MFKIGILLSLNPKIMAIRFPKHLNFNFLLFGLLLFGQLSHGQLSNFTLQLTATNETCTANGTLSFEAQNTSPGAIIIYRIFKLPDTVTPIAVTSTNTFGGLTAGNYQVIAIQSLGSLTNSQQQNITITNLIVPVTFQVTSIPAPYCGTTASITVNVDQGSPTTYEVISGPILFPPQTSNVFSGLVAGDYDIRVNDICGDGVVQTYHLQPPPPNLNIALSQFCNLTNCNTKPLDVLITANGGTAIGYPLQIRVTLNAQGFPPVEYNQTLTSGNSNQTIAAFTAPYHNVAPYTANIRIVDACGNVYTLNNSALNMTPDGNIQSESTCEGQYINIGLCNVLAPYTVNFIEAPAGFNPALYNPGNLGPFSNFPITYSSTDLNEMPDGHYVFQVTDACGNVVGGSADLNKPKTDHKVVPMFIGCDLKYFVFIPDEGVPIETIILQSAPAGYPGPVPVNLSALITGGYFSMELPVIGTYVFTGVNICGDTYIRNVTIIPPDPQVIARGSTIIGCTTGTGSATIELSGGPAIATVIMTGAPAGFNHPLPYDVTSFITTPTSCTVTGLPLGTYTFVVTDVCGATYPAVTANIIPGILQDSPTVTFLRGCEDNFGSIKMESANDAFSQVIITAAPAGFPHALPYDVSFNLTGNGVFYMNSFIEGLYTFYTKDLCGVEHTENITMLGTDVVANNVVVEGNCGSFNLRLVYVELPPFLQNFWLQKFDPVTNQWGHPYTGVPYPNNTVPSITNSYRLLNANTNYNIASLGTFRVLKYSQIYSNGAVPYSSCYTIIREFEYTGELKIESTSAVPCNNSSYDVVIGVSGIAPFIYRITTKDGNPFPVNNGNSNIFSGLAPGVYNFQVEDSCGNIVNRLLDITTLAQPTIYANNLCEGLNAQLSVQAVSFLSYQWWNGNAPGNILSTTNTLNFNPFSNATTPGTYYVRIYSTTNLSCINMTIPYVVSPSVIPNAGQDATRTICGSTATVDLFSILGTPYDTGGIWTETTNSGGLTGSNWSPAGLAYGTYVFEYAVSSSCGTADLATVTIRFNPPTPEPILSASPDFCNNDTIALVVETIPTATYHWTGPNNFSSNLQNPIISNATQVNSGTYTVTASIDGCDSSADIVVNLIPSPEYKIEQGCVNGIFTLSVKPINESFGIADVTYSWTGPSGFSSTQNPVQLNGSGPGVYQVVVKNNEGCDTSQSALVTSTLCSIPNVISPNGDNINDGFDLSGMDVFKLEIYSRWGRLVWEQRNYTDQWHGQNMHDRELPDSTYYYIIYLRTGEEKQGWVYKTPWQ